MELRHIALVGLRPRVGFTLVASAGVVLLTGCGSGVNVVGQLRPAPLSSRVAPDVLADPLHPLGRFVRQVDGSDIANLPADYLFDFDSDVLRPQAEANLAALLPTLTATNRAVGILGFTDGIGTNAYNQDLSERRAQATARWLQAHGLAATRLHPEGRGASGSTPGRPDPSRRNVQVVLEPAP